MQGQESRAQGLVIRPQTGQVVKGTPIESHHAQTMELLDDRRHESGLELGKVPVQVRKEFAQDAGSMTVHEAVWGSITSTLSPRRKT
jgi:hypothetical protein